LRGLKGDNLNWNHLGLIRLQIRNNEISGERKEQESVNRYRKDNGSGAALRIIFEEVRQPVGIMVGRKPTTARRIKTLIIWDVRGHAWLTLL
jgi:hypothetical protein